MKEPALDPGASRRPVLLAAAISAGVVALSFAWPLFVHVGLEVTADHRSDAELAPLKAIPAYSPEALEAFYEADQAGRRVAEIDWDELRVKDAERRQTVGAWLEQKQITDGRGLWCAAMIFQHGRESAHFARARDLAQEAVDAGYADAKWLRAAAEDRWLLSQDKPQRYGTQVQEVDGVWALSPVVPSVTDAERARWDVPPLAESEQRARDMNLPE